MKWTIIVPDLNTMQEIVATVRDIGDDITDIHFHASGQNHNVQIIFYSSVATYQAITQSLTPYVVEDRVVSRLTMELTV